MRIKKVAIVIISIFVLTLIYGTTLSKAALQANGNTATTQTIDNWVLNIRNMEATGGTLGLSETINGTTLLSATASNNLDIHMEKNTEYGAVAILSASSYGNQSKIEDNQTTTGNKSGIYMRIGEGVADIVSAGQVTCATRYVGMNARYKDNYTTSYVAKAGDAITETAGWGSGAQTWLNNYYVSSVLRRGFSGSVFGYYGYNDYGGNNANYGVAYPSRACVVVGERTLILYCSLFLEVGQNFKCG